MIPDTLEIREPYAMSQSFNRRRFITTTTAASTLFALPYYIPSTAFGANESILTGHIGVGGQGNGNLRKFSNHAVAICDVDQDRLAKAVKSVESRGRTCEGHGDYRKLLDRKDIDAVVISTPDHWHALTSIHACQAGKDVYCEKPLTLTIGEGRQMADAARDNQRIIQTGSQQRSAGNFRTACELVRSGKIGKLQTVLVGIPGANHPGAPVPDTDPPSNLNYDFWLGPAPLRPYNAKRVHYNFRFFWDYSGGQMTNWGAHHIDIAHWGMGMDASGPLSVEGTGVFHPKGWHEVTESCRITYKYPGDVTMIVGQALKDVPSGTTFVGSEGQIHVNRGKLSSTPADIIQQKLGTDDVHLYASGDHHANFLDCIKTRKQPICNVEVGHRSATACHLGNLAVRLGRKLNWDAEKEDFIDDQEASAMRNRACRAPYTV